MKVLFVTWDGSGPNYLESLFFPIFKRLQDNATHPFHVLQFTWTTPEQIEATRRAAVAAGIQYSASSAWRKPAGPATAGMIVRGALEIVRHARKHSITVLMPRSLIPAAMALVAQKWLPGVKLFFDADGMMADERVDFGGWSRRGPSYLALRSIERRALRQAHCVMTRTSRAKKILLERAGPMTNAAKIHVIPNGKDEDVFVPGTSNERQRLRSELGIGPDAPLLVYSGSIGPQYYPREMLTLFAEVHSARPDACLLVLTTNEEAVRALLSKDAIPRDSVRVMRVEPRDVPRYLAASDLGLALRAQSFSQQAVSPIKIAEYLLCGLPVLSTAGIGDLSLQLDSSVGKLIDNVAPASLHAARRWLFDDVLPFRERYRGACRECGVDVFGLTRCVLRYQVALQSMEGAA